MAISVKTFPGEPPLLTVDCLSVCASVVSNTQDTDRWVTTKGYRRDLSDFLDHLPDEGVEVIVTHEWYDFLERTKRWALFECGKRQKILDQVMIHLRVYESMKAGRGPDADPENLEVAGDLTVNKKDAVVGASESSCHWGVGVCKLPLLYLWATFPDAPSQHLAKIEFDDVSDTFEAAFFAAPVEGEGSWEALPLIRVESHTIAEIRRVCVRLAKAVGVRPEVPLEENTFQNLIKKVEARRQTPWRWRRRSEGGIELAKSGGQPAMIVGGVLSPDTNDTWASHVPDGETNVFPHERGLIKDATSRLGFPVPSIPKPLREKLLTELEGLAAELQDPEIEEAAKPRWVLQGTTLLCRGYRAGFDPLEGHFYALGENVGSEEDIWRAVSRSPKEVLLALMLRIKGAPPVWESIAYLEWLLIAQEHMGITYPDLHGMLIVVDRDYPTRMAAIRKRRRECLTWPRGTNLEKPGIPPELTHAPHPQRTETPMSTHDETDNPGTSEEGDTGHRTVNMVKRAGALAGKISAAKTINRATTAAGSRILKVFGFSDEVIDSEPAQKLARTLGPIAMHFGAGFLSEDRVSRGYLEQGSEYALTGELIEVGDELREALTPYVGDVVEAAKAMTMTAMLPDNGFQQETRTQTRSTVREVK